MLTPSLSLNSIHGAAGGLPEGAGRSGGSSKLKRGKFVLSSQRVSVTNSTPVKPMCDFRVSDHSLGDLAVISVTELPRCDSALISHGRPALLVLSCGLSAITANNCATMRHCVNRACVISQS